MATIQRPTKEGSVRTYQEKVALGYVDILASEMDADLDTIYAAWNGGADTINIKDGTVTYAKLAPDAQLWSDTGTALRPGANFTSRLIQIGTATMKSRLRDSAGTAQLLSNSDGTTVDDATKAQWMLQANATDTLTVHRAPAGATSTWASLLNLDATGQLTVAGVQHFFGTAAGTKLILGPTIKTHVQADGTIGSFGINHYFGPQDVTKASWSINLDLGLDQIQMSHRNANTGSSQAALFALTNAGDLYITGSHGYKAAGTTWEISSDPRLKTDVGPYQRGLAEIAQLAPISYHLKSDPDGPLCYGFDASAVRDIFPECVARRRMKLDPSDEEETDDVLTFDMHPILVALITAIKELTTRVTAVEMPA
jgi:hypothetical protein